MKKAIPTILFIIRNLLEFDNIESGIMFFFNYLLRFFAQLKYRFIGGSKLVLWLLKTNKIKKFKNKLIGIVLFGFNFTSVRSQQTVVVSGSNILNSSGSVSYSIGQIDYISTGSSITVSQGMQQGYGKLVEPIDSNIRVTVYNVKRKCTNC